MRALLFTFASLLAAGTASAASIETFKSGQSVNGSVSQVSCAQCPPPVVKKNTSYIVPNVAPGTERVELKEINGEMKLVRTEAWLGGSPVVFITKASEDALQAAQAKTVPAAQPLASEAVASAEAVPAEAQATTTVNIIDNTAKTSAVSSAAMTDMAAVTPQDTQSQEVDLENFQLRLK